LTSQLAELLVTKVDKSCRNLSLQTQTRLSELAIEKKDGFNFNNKKLQEFLKKALNHLEHSANKNDAEHIAHFLMGIKTDLPKGLDREDPSLNDEQKKYLHSAIRTNRYGIFGKEKNEKTIEKLKALNEEVNFEIKWKEKILPNTKEEKLEEKTVTKTNNGSAQPSSDPGRVSEILEKDRGNVVHEKAKPIAENQKKSENLTDVLEKLYKTASEKYSGDEEKWGKLKEKINLYFETMEREYSKNFTEILSNSGYSFDQLVEPFTMYTALSEDIANRMATERELVNIEMKGKSASQNEKVLGNKKSLAQRDTDVVQPGNQLSLATKTKIRCHNGELREIILLSESGPALDVASQPEVDIYTYKSLFGGRKLHRREFAIALETLKSHTLACATRNKDCKRVVLAAIGAANFLKILDKKHRQYAQDMIASMLAEVVIELRKQGKDVGFTDIDHVFCDKINARIDEKKLHIKVLGRIPGTWIHDGDLMLNAWDPSSLLGNGLAADNSLDGFYGRNSLIHFQHALLCIMRSLSIEVHINYVSTQVPASNSVAPSS
jgi:hypothetical protein